MPIPAYLISSKLVVNEALINSSGVSYVVNVISYVRLSHKMMWMRYLGGSFQMKRCPSGTGCRDIWPVQNRTLSIMPSDSISCFQSLTCSISIDGRWVSLTYQKKYNPSILMQECSLIKGSNLSSQN